MIRVTIDLLPKGKEPAERKGVMCIINDATGSKTVGNYNVIAGNASGSVVFQGRVRGFPRTKHGAWRLLKAALDQMYPSTTQRRR